MGNAIMTSAYADTFKDTQDIIKYYGSHATAITAALTMIISMWCSTGHKYQSLWKKMIPVYTGNLNVPAEDTGNT
jgi:hypothetical protein